MPFLHRLTLYPANGQIQLLRPLLESRIKEQQEAGYRCSLAQTIYGADSPEFDVSFAFNDMAAVETFRNAVASTQAGFWAQVAPLTTRLPHVELVRSVVAPPAPATSYAYIASWIFLPATGMFPQLRDALAQNVRENQAEGVRVAMGVAHAGAPRAYTSRLADTLAELEELAPEWNEAQAKRVEGLFSAPPVTLIRQVLVPFPAL